jgi:membrane fusion protein (multidrug efflux system)
VFWLVWFFGSRIGVYEASDDARLEVSGEVFAVQWPVGGRVVRCRELLGAVVRKGDVLCELESETERARLAAERARHAALERQLVAVREQFRQGQLALDQEGRALIASTEEANADARDAAATARRSADAIARLGGLKATGKLSEIEFVRLQSEAEGQGAIADAKALRAKRLGIEGEVALNDRRMSLERLRGDTELLLSQVSSSKAAISALEVELENHVVRAPIDGRVGELARIRSGTVVTVGDRVAAIIPDGGLRIVAAYTPAAALGRIAPGQNALFRLAGFPSTQYGALRARVFAVSLEPRDGRIRVELSVDSSNAAMAGLLRHGLPGRVEVQLERISPATLVLREAGRAVLRQRTVASES